MAASDTEQGTRHDTSVTTSTAGEAAQSRTPAAPNAQGNSAEKTTMSDGDAEQPTGEVAKEKKKKKPISFFLALTCLLITTFLAALDSTCMAVSIAVSLIVLFIYSHAIPTR